MATLDFDPKSLSIDDRLRLIDALWRSIEQSAADGDIAATQAMEQWADTEPGLLLELEHEADEAERNPESQTSWESLLDELKRKQG